LFYFQMDTRKKVCVKLLQHMHDGTALFLGENEASPDPARFAPMPESEGVACYSIQRAPAPLPTPVAAPVPIPVETPDDDSDDSSANGPLLAVFQARAINVVVEQAVKTLPPGTYLYLGRMNEPPPGGHIVELMDAAFDMPTKDDPAADGAGSTDAPDGTSGDKPAEPVPVDAAESGSAPTATPPATPAPPGPPESPALPPKTEE